MSDGCVFLDRFGYCWYFECVDCGWFSHSADLAWSQRAGEVHGTILRPGHHVVQVGCPAP